MKLSEWLHRESTTNRNTGRTYRMIRFLPRNQRIALVVHNAATMNFMADQIKLQRPDIADNVVIVWANSAVEAQQRLQGTRYDMVAVDHFCSEYWVRSQIAALEAVASTVEC